MRRIASSVTGWVMLSSMSDLEIAKLVRRVNSEMSSLEEIVKISELLPCLEGIRRNGYAFARSRVTPGTSVLAMPLPARLTKRSEEHTSELQSLMRTSYAVFCLKKNKNAK